MPVTTIRMLSDDTIPIAIPGVVVEFYSTAGAFITSGTSDSAGEVTVTLPAAFYDILMFKIGISVLPKQPQRIQVLTQVPPNVFEVTAHIRVLPETNDLTLCRVSGYVINSHGKPQKGVKISLGPTLELVDVSTRLVDPDHQVDVTSDDKGYFEFDLLRKVTYEGYILYKDDWMGQTPGTLVILAPDRPSVPLEYLLFPIPQAVDFSAPTLSVPINTIDDSITIIVTFTDGNVRQLPLQWGGYNLTISDADIFDFEVAGDKLVITGKTAGTATLTAERTLPVTSLWLPEPSFASDTLTVTVI
jgi:hypothetical protein